VALWHTAPWLKALRQIGSKATRHQGIEATRQ
jgi:hypothetical protein